MVERLAKFDPQAVETLRAAGVPTTRQERVDSPQDLEAWPRSLGGRIVVKPVRSARNRGVVLRCPRAVGRRVPPDVRGEHRQLPRPAPGHGRLALPEDHGQRHARPDQRHDDESEPVTVGRFTRTAPSSCRISPLSAIWTASACTTWNRGTEKSHRRSRNRSSEAAAPVPTGTGDRTET
ncbi:conserved hypothetical protein [Streptomyces sviceus ATCC 29083]|uniref:ATP-grasp domain-containing protein n=1 Tax=Streptomyces sviceus (strain ATCC 29083 / DSM 924 / JCM 4929 / NBRC 13980 / NCIMB 11184 / NRRL 5439 / UC 5370) TaxID=463191 RepID=B5HRT5_STRX2|nr:conserved hypothetical protein [Streptomyces sviceus ATCC 29083]